MLKSLFKSLISLTPYKIINKRYLREKFQIAEATEYERNLCRVCMRYSLTPVARLWALVQAVNEVRDKNIDGDIVESGVWKGGNLILSQLLNEKYKLNKTVYGYDTFKGMSRPGNLDVQRITGEFAEIRWEKNNRNDYNLWCYSGIEEVRENISNNVSDHDNVKLIKGKVEDTLRLEENLPESISLLRLDTDWYESTKIELEVLYPRLSKGGVLIVDDYGMWDGCRAAVDDYFRGSNIWLHYIDEDCRLLIK